MSFCPDDCEKELPQNQSVGCNTDKRRGGVRRLVFIKCNSTFADVTDLAEWQTKIEAGEIVATGELLAQKPKGSFEKQKYSSVTPEEVKAKTNTIQFKDYNAELDANGDLLFWDSIQKNYRSYGIGYTDDHDNFRGFHNNWAPEIDDTIEEDVNGSTYVDGVVTYNTPPGIDLPNMVPGLNALLASVTVTP
jgi:hypothetical protein